MSKVLLSLTLALVVSACSSSGNSPLPAAPAPAPAPPPPPTASIVFDDFVRDQINNTSDTDEPVAINDLDFEFGDDPNAFDALFSTGN